MLLQMSLSLDIFAKHAQTDPLDIKTKDTPMAIKYWKRNSNLNQTGKQTDPIIRSQINS